MTVKGSAQAAALLAQYTPAAKVRDLYSVLFLVGDILDREGLAWWAAAGTLLGAIRHRGIVPWDDDLDIAMDADDLPQLEERVLPALAAAGFDVAYPPENGRGPGLARFSPRPFVVIFPRRGKARAWFRDPNVDLFPMTRAPTGHRRFVNPDFLPRQVFAPDGIYPLRRVPFGPREVWVPKEAEAFLDRAYPDWRTHAVLDNTHSSRSGRFALDERFLHPAEPDGPLKTSLLELEEP